ncbi:MAG: beta-galactosidase GalA, partial [Bacteroidota bacterium]
MDAQGVQSRERLLLDANWRFAFGHPFDIQKDFNNGTSYFSYLSKAGFGDGAAASNFDDRAWRKLDLPHDWAVEQGFSIKASYSHGYKAIGRNFPERSVGWYRKSFDIPEGDLGRRIVVEFEGVFRNSVVWVNGHYMGLEESGYNSFQYDITEVVNYGGKNVIAVRVDATMEEGWFYEGAGIYRHVWLTKTSPVHVAQWGTFITSEVNGSNAVVAVSAEIINESKLRKDVSVVQTIIEANGKTVATRKPGNLQLNSYEKKTSTVKISISNATLWNLESPYLYTVVTVIKEGTTEIDRYETSFGIRTVRFDEKQGFFLNGQHVKLKGTNNHQNHAGVGTAIPDQLFYWRLQQLKDLGSNAYRCSHYPPSPALLDACDRLGMLVIDENRLMRTTADGLKALEGMIRRDRNHPSIIAWSVGNEEWGIETNIVGSRIATTLQNYAKSIDSTRATTAAVSGGFGEGIAPVLEVMGYNYLGNGDIDAHKKRHPDQPAMGTEEGSTHTTRGVYFTDDEKHYKAAYDQKPRPGFVSVEDGWKFYATRPYMAGVFFWTGFDYRGEPTPYGWPSVTSYFGFLDLCGFPKDNAYYLKSWWGKDPVLHLLPHWNWKGKEGETISVWAYSNSDEVELFLNKKSFGRKKVEPNGHVEWKVPYIPGTLEAVGFKDGKKALSRSIKTTDEPAQIQLVSHKNVLKANQKDIAVITVSTLDRNLIAVPTAGNEITFNLLGPGKIIGVGNGDPTSLENEKFIEAIQTVAIDSLTEKAVASIDVNNETGSGVDDRLWGDAFKNRDYRNLANAYVTRGSFTLPDNFISARVTLFYKDIGVLQSLFVNGKEIAHHKSAGQITEGITLDKSILKQGKNLIAI